MSEKWFGRYKAEKEAHERLREAVRELLAAPDAEWGDEYDEAAKRVERLLAERSEDRT